jgi:ubiquinone/menaquinone biosynthesis C-methylase UbiE
MPPTQAYQDYVGYVSPEFLRVIRQISRARKQQVYTLLRVGVGSRVLDVGCGPGTDTIPLAQLVGPTGYVVGLDQAAQPGRRLG